MNVIDLLRAKNIDPKKVSGTHGAEYHSPCPGCGGNDRFHVWPEQNDGAGSFWCRSCGKGGDAIQFLIDFDGKSFPEACALMGREMDSVPMRVVATRRAGSRDWRPDPVVDPSGIDVALWREKAGKFVDWAHEQLLKNKPALDFLARRGISEHTAAFFRLGFNPGENGKTAIFRPRKSWGLPAEIKDGKEKRLWLPRGLVVPYFSGNELVRIRIRRPDADLTEKFKQRYFVVPASRMDRTVCGDGRRMAAVVVETELDAMMIHQAAGDLVTAVSMGTSHAKPDAACHAAIEKTLAILVAMDFDKAGEGAWPWWRDQYRQAERWPVPAGKDPGDAFAAGVDIRLWVMAGLPPVITGAIEPLKQERVRVEEKKPMGRPPKAKEAQSEKQPQTEEPRASAGPVDELRRLIATCPVSIEHCDARIRIIENKDWAMKNWQASKRLSKLVFFSQEIGAFLASHPDRLITRKNFDVGRSAR